MSGYPSKCAAPCSLGEYEADFSDRHLLHGVLAHFSTRKPQADALVSHDGDRAMSWVALDAATTGLAAALLRRGFRHGDFLATSLPFSIEHVLLEYACFKIGVIHAPLDLRLRPAEVLRSIDQIHARGYAFPGRLPSADFRELGLAVKAKCGSVEHLIQFSPSDEVVEGALSFPSLLADAPVQPTAEFLRAAVDVRPTDAAQVIFTTGSTGSPKPALLSHRNITCQNLALGRAFGFGERTRLLVNLPPSHVGGQAEALMTTLFWGGTAILLSVFDPLRSLQAVQARQANILGQIPAMYHYEWRQAGYSDFDLSSLEFAIYGGQQVARQFLERLAMMAPRIGTGLGLTESAGFCTFTQPDAGVDGIMDSLGHDVPLYPMTIRHPMRPDGTAGEVLPDGEAGQVCFEGPQTFLGYAGDPEATALAISRDGVLYTGDVGCRTDRGLRFCGRTKWIIKPAGHQVFPGDVEAHFSAMSQAVGSCAAVGVPHPLLTEAIVLFVETRPGAELTAGELRRHARGIASYMRPLHYVFLEPGAMPINRAAKSDYVRLREMALAEAAKLGWTAGR
jgi:fatty-acyl-CoA synthase